MSSPVREGPLRAVVLSAEPPWPTNHGGRVDVWHRYKGLAQQGWQISLFCWTRTLDQDLQAEASRGFGGAFASVTLMPRPRGLLATCRRLWKMRNLPSLVALQDVSEADLSGIVSEAARIAPAVVIAEGIYTAHLARRLADAVGAALVVRSHNIEHQYMAVQYRLANSPRTRLSIAAALLHLRKYELRAIKDADHVLEISSDAVSFWREHGVRYVDWVPTIVPALERSDRRVIPWSERAQDAVYLGNLWSPNNIEAVNWLISEVLPHVRKSAPGFKLLIAGSNPPEELRARLANEANVDLMADPPDANSVRAQARVLVNPILKGSGLNTKTVEMLFLDSPLVLTPFAAEGLDPETKTCFELESSAEGFARAMVQRAGKPFEVDHRRLDARARFGQAGARRLSELLKTVQRQDHPTTSSRTS